MRIQAEPARLFALCIAERRIARLAAVFAFIAAAALSAPRAFACNPCAIYNVTQLHGLDDGTFSLSLAEQFTSYELTSNALALRDGELIKGYSATQLTAGYDFSKHFSAQLTLPYIVRDFDHIESFRRQRKTESGIGDASLLLNYAPLGADAWEFPIFWVVSGGVKLPTGDSGSLDRLVGAGQAGAGEASAARDLPRPDPSMLAHHPIATLSGGEGRALTLGSGSVDYLLGTSVLARKERLLFFASLQYTIRTEGDFDYEFDDDLVWSAGPAYLLLLDDAYTAALKASVSGEHKGNDTLEGRTVRSTAVSNVFFGPELLVSIGKTTSLQAAFELPVHTEDFGGVVEPEWRMRLSAAYRF